jgi:nicotinamide riboside transporter PnuC
VTPLHWLIAAASLAGVVLNIRRRRACFAIWMATNTSWCVVDAHAGLPAQASLMAVYAGLAVWGYLAWRPPAPPGRD